MRRAVVVLLLLGMMLGLRALKAEDATAIGNPLTLAAIGFVVLASFAMAEAGGSLRLPRVTGYIIAGVLLGPSMLDVLSAPVVREMQVFNTLALGLIAVGAGLELDVRSIRRLWRTHVVTTLVKLVGGGALVGGSFALAESSLGILGLHGGALWAVALVLGTLSVGTSPAVALALIKEMGASGRLSDLVLGAAVLKDLVVVVSLAVAVAVARALVQPDAELDPSLILAVGKEIGASVAAGALLGAVLIAYIRFVKAEMLLFVAAMILVVGEVSRTLHLELLLVFIVAGFVVRNASRFEHELMGAITMVALPVFVVFFTIAGASVDIVTTRALLPIAATIVVARALGFVAASYVGGWAGREPAGLRRLAWLGYLPQAGVTLGLVGLAATQLPDIGDAVRSTGMAVVALNLLIGPITLRRALQSAGETATSNSSTETAAPEPESGARLEARTSGFLVGGSNRNAELAAALSEVESVPVRKHMRLLAQDLRERLAAFVGEHVAAWTDSDVAHAQSGGPTTDGIEKSITAGDEHDFEELSARATGLRGLFGSLRARLRDLPERVDVPLAPRLLTRCPSDLGGVRIRRHVRSLLSRVSRRWARRLVPLRLAARLALEARLADYCVGVFAACMRLRGELLDELRRQAQNRQDGDVTARRLGELRSRLTEVALDDGLHALAAGFTELAKLVTTADSPERPLGAIRVSAAEPAIAKAIARLDSAAIDWRDRLRAARAEAALGIALFRAERAAARVVDAHVIAPIGRALTRAKRLVETAGGRIDGVIELAASRGALPESFREPAGDGSAQDGLGSVGGPMTGVGIGPDAVTSSNPRSAEETKRQAVLGKDDFDELRALANAVWTAVERTSAEQAFVALRGELEIHEAVVALRGLIESLPEQVTVTVQGKGLPHASWASDVQIRRIAVRATAHRALVGDSVPVFDELARDASSCVSETGRWLSDAASLLEDAIACRRDAPEHAMRADKLLHDDVRRSRGLVRKADAALNGLEERLCHAADAAVSALFAELARAIGAEDRAPVGSASALRRLARWIRTRTAPAAKRVLGLLRRGVRLAGHAVGVGTLRTPRAGERAVDAAQVRAILGPWLDAPQVSPAYERLFRAAPLREPRFFTARSTELERIVEAEHLWMQDEGASSVVVLGEPGSGRSSLLNMAALQLRASRVLRPARARGPHADTLVEALGLELASGFTAASVRRSLTGERTTVLLDDLEQWFTPDDAGVVELERIIDLVVATQGSVFWIATVNAAALDVVEDWLPVREAFGQAVELAPLTPAELCSVIEARHRSSGRELRYPRTVLSRFLGGFRSTSDRALYHRLLATVVDGNLQHALAVWLRAISFDSEGTVTPTLARTLAAASPLGASLGAAQTALLARLMRFGPARPAEIGAHLGLAPHEMALHLSFLRAAGLVDVLAADPAAVEVPAAVRRVVARVLSSAGLWRVRS